MLLFDIQHFAEGGGDGAGTGATGVAGSVAGSQTSESGNATETATQEDIAKRFAEVRNGEFKDLFNKEISDTVQKRLGKLQSENAQYKGYDSVIDAIAKKYGVDRSNPESLLSALDEDDSFYEQESLDTGVPIEQLKKIKKMERENEQLRAYKDSQEQEKQTNQIISKWLQESEALKPIYPNFDFDTEMSSNPQFKRLITSGIDVRSAYEVCHLDDIVTAGYQFATQKTAEQVGASVQANRNRPRENGLSKAATGQISTDVNSMTKEDRRRLNERVMRGELISL